MHKKIKFYKSNQKKKTASDLFYECEKIVTEHEKTIKITEMTVWISK